MITALSPLDGRYHTTTEPLSHFFSESALIKYRLKVEIAWLSFLSEQQEVTELRRFSDKENQILHNIIEKFSSTDAKRVKEIEATTKHDVKAVEYFLKESLEKTSLQDISEWIHFGCTSEDINNLSYALMLRDACNSIILPEIDKLYTSLEEKAQEWKSVPLLSLTHGQSASPTTVGKTLLVHVSRLERQIFFFEDQEFLGKINGATGNFNAHHIAYPKVDWMTLAQSFVEHIGLAYTPLTDQIEPHDFIAELSHTCMRINTVLIDYSRDTWGYISRGIFGQKTKAGEIGSSTMPHKINPIDFENAEGNLGIANALFGFFAEKLPITRWQRDLTDSTVIRNIGVSFGHMLIAIKSLQKGLEKLEIKPEIAKRELANNVEVLGEAAQTIMRKCKIEKPYEKLKELTRGRRISQEDFIDFVKEIGLPKEEEIKLINLTPDKYIGLAEDLVKKYSEDFDSTEHYHNH